MVTRDTSYMFQACNRTILLITLYGGGNPKNTHRSSGRKTHLENHIFLRFLLSRYGIALRLPAPPVAPVSFLVISGPETLLLK